MPDDRSKSASLTIWLLVAIAVLVALAGLCFCGGFGLFFVRARSVGPPAAAPGRPAPANQSMLKRFVDDIMGVPPPPPLPVPPPPIAQPPEPAELERPPVEPEPPPVEQPP